MERRYHYPTLYVTPYPFSSYHQRTSADLASYTLKLLLVKFNQFPSPIQQSSTSHSCFPSIGPITNQMTGSLQKKEKKKNSQESNYSNLSRQKLKPRTTAPLLRSAPCSYSLSPSPTAGQLCPYRELHGPERSFLCIHRTFKSSTMYIFKQCFPVEHC